MYIECISQKKKVLHKPLNSLIFFVRNNTSRHAPHTCMIIEAYISSYNMIFSVTTLLHLDRDKKSNATVYCEILLILNCNRM